MKRTRLIAPLFALGLLAAPTFADVEITPFGAYRFGGEFESSDDFIDIDASQEWLHKAKRKMARGQHAVAIPLLNKAIEYDPDNARAYYNLGLSYVMVGDVRQARRQQRLLHDMDRNLANLLDTLLR